MTVTLYAQPYDLAATGFSFQDAESYRRKIGTIRNAYGQPVEEFEIQLIEGAALDVALADAFQLSQANVTRFFEVVDAWDEWQKLRFIIGVGECGGSFDFRTDKPDDLEVDIYEVESLRDLAAEFVDDGLFGPVPDALAPYIDYDAIARDLAVDYTETEIAGRRLIYRAA